MSNLSEALQAQLLRGDWDAVADAVFDVREEHLLDRFVLEDLYGRFEARDYGLNGAPWALVAVDYRGNLALVDMVYERDLLSLRVLDEARPVRGAGASVRDGRRGSGPEARRAVECVRRGVGLAGAARLVVPDLREEIGCPVRTRDNATAEGFETPDVGGGREPEWPGQPSPQQWQEMETMLGAYEVSHAHTRAA